MIATWRPAVNVAVGNKLHGSLYQLGNDLQRSIKPQKEMGLRTSRTVVLGNKKEIVTADYMRDLPQRGRERMSEQPAAQRGAGEAPKDASPTAY